MLVRLKRRASDDGSTLVSVLVVSLVLSILVITTATLVVGTTGSLAGTRSTLQSQAAADAGLADILATAKRESAPCGLAANETFSGETGSVVSRYEATSTCAGGQVTLRSTGFAENGGRTIIEAVYALDVEPSEGEDMVFFGNATFTADITTHPLDDRLLSILVPQGNLDCHNQIPANVIVDGNLTTRSSCVIEGTAVVGGDAEMTGAANLIRGDLYVSGTGTVNMQGMVDGDIRTGGGIAFGWTGVTYPGNVSAGGDVNLTNVSIGGSLALPASASLQTDGYLNVPSGTTTHARIGGGLSWPETVSPPTRPVFDGWFSYQFSPSDWPGYTVQTLVNGGTGAGSCASFNSWPQSGWTALDSLTTPTVIDARACGTLSSNAGTSPVVTLQTDVVFLADHFDLTSLTMQPAAGTSPQVWWIVEDRDPHVSGPSCTGGAGSVGINHTVMAEGISAMAYTPCVINWAGGGEWHGSFYSGGLQQGGSFSFSGSPIALPGQSTGGGGTGATPSGIGGLISRRDVPAS